MLIEHGPAKSSRIVQASSPDTFLTESETAEILKLSQRTLQRWRVEGSQGLPFRRFGGVIRYSLSDIERWAAKQSRMSTSEAGQ
jgi:hypothetical protein